MNPEKLRLSEIASLRTGKLDSNAAVANGEYPFFTCAQETYRIDNYAFDTEAVLLGGNNAEGIFPLKYYNGKFNAYQRTYVIESRDKSILSTRYLYYALRPALSYFKSASIGAATQYLTKGILDNFLIHLPSVKLQESIVNCASAYDDLIDNNRRRIELLEEAARLNFKEWFVHLRYPGHERDKIVDGVPEGWNKRSFSELAEFINGFAFKPYHWGEAGLPIVKIPELRGGIGSGTPRYSGSQVPDKYKIRRGDLLFSWSGTLAVEFWVEEDAYLNQHLFLVKPYGRPGAAFLLLALRESIRGFRTLSVGATMKHIRRSALDQSWILVPREPLLFEFESGINDIYAMVINLRRQNVSLSRARKLLLPRLMDGSISV